VLPDALRKQFPLTAAAFADLRDEQGRADPRAADEALRHIAYLDQRFGRRSQAAPVLHPPQRRAGREPAEQPRFDVVLAGGGLSLIYAAALGRAGARVAVFDRRRIGCGHREWNISRDELRPLIESGLFTAAEVERLVLLQYDSGFCRFAGGGSYPVREVLDCVIDAETLLAALRERAAAAACRCARSRPRRAARSRRAATTRRPPPRRRSRCARGCSSTAWAPPARTRASTCAARPSAACSTACSWAAARSRWTRASARSW
jgi:hypothetical protein